MKGCTSQSTHSVRNLYEAQKGRKTTVVMVGKGSIRADGRNQKDKSGPQGFKSLNLDGKKKKG